MEGSVRSLSEKLVPLVASLVEEPHQPSVFSNVTLVSALQPENAYASISVTLSGIVMLVSKSQFLNAELPILVMRSGMFMLVREMQ